MNYDQMKNGNLKLLQSTQNGSYIPTRIPTVLASSCKSDYFFSCHAVAF